MTTSKVQTFAAAECHAGRHSLSFGLCPLSAATFRGIRLSLGEAVWEGLDHCRDAQGPKQKLTDEIGLQLNSDRTLVSRMSTLVNLGMATKTPTPSAKTSGAENTQLFCMPEFICDLGMATKTPTPSAITSGAENTQLFCMPKFICDENHQCVCSQLECQIMTITLTQEGEMG